MQGLWLFLLDARTLAVLGVAALAALRAASLPEASTISPNLTQPATP